VDPCRQVVEVLLEEPAKLYILDIKKALTILQVHALYELNYTYFEIYSIFC
jgi:hypothetical protein